MGSWRGACPKGPSFLQVTLFHLTWLQPLWDREDSECPQSRTGDPGDLSVPPHMTGPAGSLVPGPRASRRRGEQTQGPQNIIMAETTSALRTEAVITGEQTHNKFQNVTLTIPRPERGKLSGGSPYPGENGSMRNSVQSG